MLRAFLLAALLAVSGTARAQAGPDITDAVIQGQQVNDAVSRAMRTRVQGDAAPDDKIDGEAGVYVMRLNEIFSITASGGMGFTTNPQRTADNIESSFYGDFNMAAGVATRLGEAVDLGLSASVGGRQFFESFAPSTRTLSGNFSLGMPVGRSPLYVGVVGFGGYSFDDSIRGGTSFYGASGSVSAAIPVTQSVVVRPGIGVTRQWSGVSENNSNSLSGSVELLAALAPRVTASIRGNLSRRWYDDFYEDVTFVKRVDMQYQIGAVIAWQATDRLTLAINGGYEKQDSRFFLSDFDAFDAGIGVALNFRF